MLGVAIVITGITGYATAGDMTSEASPLCLLLPSSLDPSGRSTSPKR